MTIGLQDKVAPAESTDQHQESGLGQVEIRQQRAHDPKSEAGIDEEVGFALLGSNAAIAGLGYGVLKRAYRGCADRDNSAALLERTVDCGGCVPGNGIALFVKAVILDALDADGLKRTEAHVQCDFGDFDAALLKAAQDFGREVEAGSGRGNRTALAGVDGLVALAIPLAVFAGNVRWQGHVAKSFYDFEKIVQRRKADATLPKLSPAEHFRLEIIMLPKKEVLAHTDFSPRANQAFPLARILIELARQQDLHPAVEKITRGRIPLAYGLRFGTRPPSVKAGGKHAGIVEDHEVIGAQQVGEIPKNSIFEPRVLALDMEQARISTVGERFLRNLKLGQVVMKMGDEHAARL